MSEPDTHPSKETLGTTNAERSRGNYFRGILLLVIVIAAVYLIVRNLSVFGNVLVVLLGFGGVIIVHEFGHFLVAKLSDIKVEAFSIFMPPTLLGLQRTEKGLRIRILPKFFPKPKKDEDEPDEGPLSFTIGSSGRASDTEYRIGLIPLGGFVKMLGQDDAGTAKTTDDPRSYANKPVRTRMAVISAGVAFNALSAVMAFMVVFLVGIELPPPIVGGVIAGSPAAEAGLKPGDEVIEIDGKSKKLDFSNVLLGAALSGPGQEVELKVKRGDEILDFSILPKEIEPARAGMRLFGIYQPQTLTIANVSDPNVLRAQTGLLPGDRVVSVNDKNVEAYWDMAEIIEQVHEPSVTLLVKRTVESGKAELVDCKVPLAWLFSKGYEVASEDELCNVASMVPRLRITTVQKSVSLKDRFLSKLGISKKTSDPKPRLKRGDVILAVGDVENPTYQELRELTQQHEDQDLSIQVLRTEADGTEKVLTVSVKPKRPRGGKRPIIGIGLALDSEHPVVAKTVAGNLKTGPLAIPRGAEITAVNGTAVSNFYDVVEQIRANKGPVVRLDYSLDAKTHQVSFEAEDPQELIDVRSAFAAVVPFKNMKKLYKASGPIDAVTTGYRKTIMFIAQTYITLRRLVSGLVSPRTLLGPVGILAVSYTVVTDQPLINYVYLLALISACIAVVNFLPLPPFDGGHIVLLMIEKIKGSALSERTQGAIAYAGVMVIIALFLYLTFNDILNIVVH